MIFLINLPIWSNAETIKIGYINQVDVDSLHITMQWAIDIDRPIVWMLRRAFTEQSTNDSAWRVMEVIYNAIKVDQINVNLFLDTRK